LLCLLRLRLLCLLRLRGCVRVALQRLHLRNRGQRRGDEGAPHRPPAATTTSGSPRSIAARTADCSGVSGGGGGEGREGQPLGAPAAARAAAGSTEAIRARCGTCRLAGESTAVRLLLRLLLLQAGGAV
jgi:hypothetical protein